ncbi:MULTISPECIES: TolC family protein [unclassified Arcicella]|uniref:TolC family protein n=1 Tax=unclassified Arcicella TaxID=2644986 RepID=UPI00285B003E|nr:MULTISPECIES: TolC family protein [unclassified Arcicella]MDR6563354.1 outer membrane protein TolC [Arcicella sp. BE51]MDR6813225.1 outer membrane protein TolC [Arcicella sp. BE140]MDR6824539.1 outer membrane protein TolC [Arcicella sp. BE139]
MRKLLRGNLLLFSILITSQFVKAQQSYSLREAVDYAVKNHTSIKNAQIDILTAEARVSELKGIGLPQVSGNIGYTNNLIIQKVFIPAKTFDPSAKEGDVIAAEFGVANSGQAGVNLNQILFDGSYLLGLKAADVYKELSKKTLVQTKQQAAENVTKAYYSILVNEERIKLLDLNIGRLDSLLRDTKALNVQGFTEKIDVQRLEVQMNNLKIEAKNVQRLQDLSYHLLKFQMGKKITENITLTDKLADVKISEVLPETPQDIKYGNRIEYSILETQNRLAELDVKNQKVGYLPRVMLTGGYNYSAGRPKFSDLVTKPWFNAATLGLSIQIPIFDGFQKKYKIVQSQNSLQKVKNSFELLENSIDLQVTQSHITLKNAYETLEEQKANMELAKEVVRVTKIKYQQGVGSNLEVVNAEIAYKEAQTNYFTTFYNALVAKVDLDKALGRLYTE